MAPTPEKEYTSEEVEQHNTAGDCWVIIGNDNTGMFDLVSIDLLVVVCQVHALSGGRKESQDREPFY